MDIIAYAPTVSMAKIVNSLATIAMRIHAMRAHVKYSMAAAIDVIVHSVLAALTARSIRTMNVNRIRANEAQHVQTN